MKFSTPRFWINSCGEFGRLTQDAKGRKHDELLGGCYNANDVDAVCVELFGRKPPSYPGKMPPEEYKKLWATVAERFDKPKLDEKEWAILLRFTDLQEFHTNLFRFYGGVNAGEPYLTLEFETYLFQDDKGAADRKLVDDFLTWMRSEKIEYELDDMRVDVENRHSWKTDENRQKIPGSDVYGPNHGRPFVQTGVEIDLLKIKAAPGDVKMLIDKLFTEMKKTGVDQLLASVS